MPNFVGQPLSSATQALNAAGMKLGTVVNAPAPAGDTSPPAPVTPTSLIVSQTPAAGEKVVAGQTINFEVGR
jgi:beta-lactam-binding protein with PASTA domain